MAIERLVCTLLAVLGSWSALAAPARLPIVFAHGMAAPWQLYETVVPLKARLARLGYRLEVARTPPSGSIAARAEVLRDEIERLVPEGRLHLVGHSMGGLDIRLAVAKYGLSGRVASVTTLATPHRGSEVADYVVAQLSRDRGPGASLALAILERLFGGDLAAARDLTRESMARDFNPSVQDDPRIRYFSVGFVTPRPVERHAVAPWLWPMSRIMEDAGNRDNDCVVSVDSARWGEYLGTLASDHVAETSQVPARGGANYIEVFRLVAKKLDSIEW